MRLPYFGHLVRASLGKDHHTVVMAAL